MAKRYGDDPRKMILVSLPTSVLRNLNQVAEHSKRSHFITAVLREEIRQRTSQAK